MELFCDAGKDSVRRRAARLGALGTASAALHLIAVALLVAVPVFVPPPVPDSPGVLGRLIFDPPPPPPPPLPRGSPLRAAVRPAPVRPVAEEPRSLPSAAIEAPQPEPTPEPLAESTPQAGVRTEDSFGSETGSERGDPMGQDGGIDGGVPGGSPGGAPGGMLGGTGTGAGLDYDSPPRLARATRPVYPHEAFVRKIEGDVLVEILIDARGHVARARVLRSIPLLDAAAVQCVNEWSFQPAVKRGRPVVSLAHAPVGFRIF